MRQSPHGATGPIGYQHGIAVPTGWRKPTAGLAIAEELADAGEAANVSKSRAFVAVKRVGAHIGLKASDMMLLDTLGAFTQTQDWGQGRRPIVWASNAYLIEQTGFSLSALKRHARRLAETGVIAFKDSPNGKRWGRRNAEGVIIEAYGFDLGPLAARAEEFEALHTQVQAERALCQRIKRQITVSRRMIRAQIETALTTDHSGPWVQLREVFEDLLAKLPRRKATPDALERLLGWFKDLETRVAQTFLKAAKPVDNAGIETVSPIQKTENMDPTGVRNDPHIPTTNELNSVTCKSSENENAAGGSEPKDTDDQNEPQAKRGAALDVSTVMQACPEFATWARNMGGYLNDWGDVHRAAGQLRPMIGVSEHAWNTAQDRLGPQMATAALVLVFDKHCTGEVSSAGGYLRGMVEKAGAGALHLERSFYGRLSGRAA